MYSEKENYFFSISRAVVDLHGFFIVCEDNTIIDNPKILVNLLTEKELVAYDNFSERHYLDKLDIEDSIISTKVVTVIDNEEREISLTYSPAGIISFIVEAILLKSKEFLNYPVESFDYYSENVNFIEEMMSIISYYSNTPYDTVAGWPINQIFKRYAICQSAFSSQIQPIAQSEEG